MRSSRPCLKSLADDELLAGLSSIVGDAIRSQQLWLHVGIANQKRMLRSARDGDRIQIGQVVSHEQPRMGPH